jgi:hypothetical protein
MDFSYLQHMWDATNLMLQDLMGPAVDRAAVLFALIWSIHRNLEFQLVGIQST